jgi:hypothetical protein
VRRPGRQGGRAAGHRAGASSFSTGRLPNATPEIGVSSRRTTGCQIHDGDVTTLSTTDLDGNPVTINGTLNGSPLLALAYPAA